MVNVMAEGSKPKFILDGDENTNQLFRPLNNSTNPRLADAVVTENSYADTGRTPRDHR